MAILTDSGTRVIVQGITGKQGSFHTEQMLKYGTNIVAGVTPGKGGQQALGIPVYDTVRLALKEHPADYSIIFVPAPNAKSAALDALNAGLSTVIITEGIPVHDAIDIMQAAKEKQLTVIGPNCPGIISPGKTKIGIMPNNVFYPGRVGVVSRSGTLTYEVVDSLTRKGMGQSTVIGIGGDAVTGLDFAGALELFEADDETDAIVLIGEIGGSAEENAAAYIRENVNKPVVAYIAGRTAPPGKRMGHAGAIIEGNTGTAESKIAALEDAGVKVAKLPSEVADLLIS